MYYVYRITNIKENKHYYGYRGAVNPKDDLGIIYFSSSRDENFMLEQKQTPYLYKYKIILITTKLKAQNLEIRLHKKFNVGRNENFYNKVTQTHKALIGTKECSLKGAETCRKKDLYKIRSIIHSKYQNEIQDSGLTRAEETGLKTSKTRKEMFKKGTLLKRNKGLNTMALRINICNENGQVIYSCYGDFEEVCKANNLPRSFLKKSYQSPKIIKFDNKKGISRVYWNKYSTFKGWCAIKV